MPPRENLKAHLLLNGRKRLRLSITSSKALFSVFLATNILNPYMIIFNNRDRWDHAKFGVSDVGCELYLMELYHKSIDDCSVIEQANEIQSLAKEHERFLCVLPDKSIVFF